MENVFRTVLNMSLTASYVIIFVLMVRFPLKKAPRAISYALWSVVGFRLVLPFSFESMFSLIPFTAQLIPPTVALGESVSFVSALGAAVESIGDAANGGIGAVTVHLGKTTGGYLITTEAYHSQVWLLFGSYLWLIGAVAMLLYSVVSIALLRRRLRGAVLSEGNAYEVENLGTPFVLGIVRPRIFIPVGLSPEQRRYILLHEQTHIRRWDHLVKLLSFITLSVHWFNPLVWTAFMLMSTDMELSCDERVIQAMGGEIRRSYARSLLSLAAGKRMISGSPLAFGEGSVRGRITNVLNYKKPTLWIMVVAIIAVTVIGTGLLANPLRSTAEPVQSDQHLTFSSNETDLVKLGITALDQYMTLQMSEKTPISERIASYQLNRASVLAGDRNEFCVALNYDFVTDSDGYMNPARGAKGKGAWPDNYLEIRVKHLGDGMYAVVGLGTGGGGQGLTPHAVPQTKLEPLAAHWSPEQSIGVGMVELDYASGDRLIFHDYFGLFVYDLSSRQIMRSLDLKPLDCTATQGDNYCDVTVSTDGNTVQLHRMSSKTMYVYTVSDNTLRETAFERMSDRFGLLSQFPHARSGFVPIEQVIDTTELGAYSYNAVRFHTGEYGYLKTSDWTLRTLTYVRGDMVVRLFE